MTPAPTTPALKTNMGLSLSRRRRHEPHRGEPRERRHADPRADAPDADRVEPGDLHVGQPGAEPEARQAHERRQRALALAVAGERRQDGDVAEQPEQPDGHARQLRVARFLHGGAPRCDCAHGLGTGVVDDGQVAGDAEAGRRDQDGDAPHRSAFCSAAASSTPEPITVVLPFLVTAKVGVELTRSWLASASAFVIPASEPAATTLAGSAPAAVATERRKESVT